MVVFAVVNPDCCIVGFVQMTYTNMVKILFSNHEPRYRRSKRKAAVSVKDEHWQSLSLNKQRPSSLFASLEGSLQLRRTACEHVPCLLLPRLWKV